MGVCPRMEPFTVVTLSGVLYAIGSQPNNILAIRALSISKYLPPFTNTTSIHLMAHYSYGITV